MSDKEFKIQVKWKLFFGYPTFYRMPFQQKKKDFFTLVQQIFHPLKEHKCPQKQWTVPMLSLDNGSQNCKPRTPVPRHPLSNTQQSCHTQYKMILLTPGILQRRLILPEWELHLTTETFLSRMSLKLDNPVKTIIWKFPKSPNFQLI